MSYVDEMSRRGRFRCGSNMDVYTTKKSEDYNANSRFQCTYLYCAHSEAMWSEEMKCRLEEPKHFGPRVCGVEQHRANIINFDLKK